MTNKELVIKAQKKIETLKKNYMNVLNPVVCNIKLSNLPDLETVLKCQQVGNEYFNYVEEFVGNSGLLGAHKNGKWVTGFAETCRSVLESYLIHIQFIKSWLPEMCEPSSSSLANMQRMVKEYCKKDKTKKLHQEFSENNLPITGFIIPAAPDEIKTPFWQMITSISIGSTGILIVLLLVISIPEPTRFQWFVFRGLLAISIASFAAIIPGFINIRVNASSYFSIMAGGAIAIFIIIWLFNPPKIVDNIDNTKIINNCLFG